MLMRGRRDGKEGAKGARWVSGLGGDMGWRTPLQVREADGS